jgi:hypothetical protein
MKKIVLLIVVSAIVCSCQQRQKTQLSQMTDKTFFNGIWVYRSMLNIPDENIPFSRIDTSEKKECRCTSDLEFATAVMKLISHENDSISGDLDMGSSGKLLMKGKIHYCNNEISSFELQGDGIEGTSTQGWIYNYYGVIIPRWKQGVNQLDALVGSVVRTVDHGNAKAGKVASFYMVKK